MALPGMLPGSPFESPPGMALLEMVPRMPPETGMLPGTGIVPGLEMGPEGVQGGSPKMDPGRHAGTTPGGTHPLQGIQGGSTCTAQCVAPGLAES